jgi:hypothetical protein
MPRYLTIGAFAVAGWTLGWAEDPLTGILPALVVFASALTSFTLWANRGHPWHDRAVILWLLPGIAAAVWIALAGLALDVERSNWERIAFEVGPGVALTGLLCTLISYHGRHHPAENEDGRPEGRPS